MNFNGKTYLITGSSSGIGKQIAQFCNSCGANVLLVGRDREKLESVKACMSDIAHCNTYVCDLTDTVSLSNLTNCINSMYKLDGIIHSAGISITTQFKQVEIRSIEKTFSTNIISFGILLSGLRQSINHNGSIVVISSVMSLAGQKAKLSYCSSKGALDAYIRSAALELSKDKIRINSVLPGVVETPLQAKLFSKLPEESTRNIINSHPLGLGQMDDIVNVVAFLLSDRSKFITGQQIIADGGYLAQ